MDPMKRNTEDERLVIIDNMGFWKQLRFGLALKRAGIPHIVDRKPRSVSIRWQDIDQAGTIWEGISGSSK